MTELPALRPTDNALRKGALTDPVMLSVGALGLLIGVFTAFVPSVALVLVWMALWVGLTPKVGPLRRRATRRAQSHKAQTAELHKQQQEVSLLAQVPPAGRERYLELKLEAAEVVAAKVEDPIRATAFAEVRTQLGELLMAYLRMLVALANLDRFLANVDQLRLHREIEGIEKEIVTSSPRVKTVKEARRDILSKRRDRLEEATEQREVVATQLAMIEDIVGLMREAALVSPDPADIGQQLSGWMEQVEAAEDAVRELHGWSSDLHEFDDRIAG